MRIAVLMSTYNGEKYIREQIDSILCQNGDFIINIFVRDDGSTDLTKDILNEYSSKNLIEWYEGENLGPALSFLDLLKKYKGYDYYAFADQDDFWQSDKLYRAINYIDTVDDKVVYCSNAELVDEKLNSMNRKVYRKQPSLKFNTLCCSGGILGCTIVFNDKMAQSIQDKRLPKKIVMHDFYICQLCLSLGGVIVYDNYASIKYRQHGNNVVGVSNGILANIRNRFTDIFTHLENGIAEQSHEILELYKDEIEESKIIWLKNIADYKNNIINRICLSFSKKTKYINFNNSLKIRLSILFGNR